MNVCENLIVSLKKKGGVRCLVVIIDFLYCVSLHITFK